MIALAFLAGTVAGLVLAFLGCLALGACVAGDDRGPDVTGGAR